jgi:gluconate 5-dehydrogenase
MERFRMDEKVSLVTGGSRGIGLGIARTLAAAGSHIALIARDRTALAQAAESLSATGMRVWTFTADLGLVDAIPNLYQRVVAATGGADVLVNAAGGTRRGPAESLSTTDWNFVINLNLSAVFALCRAFGQERIASGKPGSIVNIASLMSEIVREENAAYAASKGGVRQLTKALAVEWARHGIRVNAVGPGFVRTELTRPLWENATFEAWVRKRTPAGRWGVPQDIADAALYLASPASDYVNGQTLYVDGGFLSTMGPIC